MVVKIKSNVWCQFECSIFDMLTNELFAQIYSFNKISIVLLVKCSQYETIWNVKNTQNVRNMRNARFKYMNWAESNWMVVIVMTWFQVLEKLLHRTSGTTTKIHKLISVLRQLCSDKYYVLFCLFLVYFYVPFFHHFNFEIFKMKKMVSKNLE